MGILKLAEKRYSCRSYKNTFVENELLLECVEAARLAPSACNSQPWKFIIVNDESKRLQCADACKNKVAKLNLWIDQAPVLIVVVTDNKNITTKVANLLKGKEYHRYDQGGSVEHLCLRASELGLATCIIGWFNEKRIKRILSVPPLLSVGLVISIGYPAKETIPAKKRKSIEDIISYNKY
jgi:nitroreductase